MENKQDCVTTNNSKVNKKNEETLIKKKHLEPLEKTILELNEEIKILQKKKKNIKLRAQAEIENIIKKNEIKKKYIKDEQFILFMKKIIPIANQLKNLYKNKKNIEKYNQNTILGIKLIFKTMLNTFFQFKIKQEGKVNELFNKKIHKINQKKNFIDSGQPQYINKIIQNGYSFGDVILSPAIVEVYEK
ncbi:nucleotide exchange factor GrpE [Buchnera aphidicola (Thelaxes californica)]|uniref:Nucleotide exchange factor GrpE n=1 Tax=Buchnera aphidicola (Thelaxes californica) TaxID=1315998 RepID=A0A4D6Y9L5_9GAMM|nr:nucleotide exchange factor GrpE [Buchnera aphidicola]QCI26696.1 nucleotide exchange factor GrpE [Buchnera aphidicola (Thelaxes californica)]